MQDVNRTQSGSEHENLSEQALDYRLTRMLDDIARGIKVAPGAVGNLLTDLANVRESLRAEVERLRTWGDRNDRYISDMVALEKRADAAEAEAERLREMVQNFTPGILYAGQDIRAAFRQVTT